MSQVKHSKFAARKGATLSCGKCGKNIEKGTTYQWAQIGWGGTKISRCMGCEIRRSEITTSKLQGVYASTEAAEDALNGLDTSNADVRASLIEDIEAILNDCATGWREVASEYEEAIDAVGDAFGEQMQNRLDSIESAADELEGWSADSDEAEECDGHEGDAADCDACIEFSVAWATETIDAAISAISDAESYIE